MDVDVTAIDFSPRMLSYAKKSAFKLGIDVKLHLMDVQQLQFPDKNFDTVFGTFVFSSFPDPLAGLRELRRVCKPDGKLLLLEHIRPHNSFMGLLFDAMNPIDFPPVYYGIMWAWCDQTSFFELYAQIQLVAIALSFIE